MISVRYAPGALLAISLALIPTVQHTYLGWVVQDKFDTGAISTRLAGLEGVSTNRSPAWVEEKFGSTDFIERRYGNLTLFVARSYDTKRLYHHPELAIAHGQQFDQRAIIQPAGRLDIPIHEIRGKGIVAAYALRYADEFVEDPIRFQLRNAFALTVRPRHMMTLFFVHGPDNASSDTTRRNRVIELLLATIDSFASQDGSKR